MTEKSPASVAHVEQPAAMPLATQAETAAVQPGQTAATITNSQVRKTACRGTH